MAISITLECIRQLQPYMLLQQVEHMRPLVSSVLVTEQLLIRC